jgi:hypothetical protein
MTNAGTPARKEEPDGAPLFGLVHFDGGTRAASRVFVPFPSAQAADCYATRHGLHDYVVAPLSFLAVR